MEAKRAPTNELRRKAFHIGGIILLPISWIDPVLVPWALLVMSLFYWAIEALAASGSRIPYLYDLIQSCKRPERKDRIDPGPFYLAAGVALPFLFFPVVAAQIGLIHVCLADAAACLIPHYLPSKWRLPFPYASEKSLTGSVAFLLVAFIGTVFFLSWPKAILIAAIGAVLESLPPRDIDNLTVPLGVSLAVSLMGWG
jgi:dolichol kinase